MQAVHHCLTLYSSLAQQGRSHNLHSISGTLKRVKQPPSSHQAHPLDALCLQGISPALALQPLGGDQALDFGGTAVSLAVLLGEGALVCVDVPAGGSYVIV